MTTRCAPSVTASIVRRCTRGRKDNVFAHPATGSGLCAEMLRNRTRRHTERWLRELTLRAVGCNGGPAYALPDAHRSGLPVQPDLAGRCAGPGDGLDPGAARPGPRDASAGAVRRGAARAVGDPPRRL